MTENASMRREVSGWLSVLFQRDDEENIWDYFAASVIAVAVFNSTTSCSLWLLSNKNEQSKFKKKKNTSFLSVKTGMNQWWIVKPLLSLFINSLVFSPLEKIKVKTLLIRMANIYKSHLKLINLLCNPGRESLTCIFTTLRIHIYVLLRVLTMATLPPFLKQ